MSEIEQKLEQVEVSMEVAKAHIDLKQALVRLFDNEDFKTVVAEGYFGNEAKRAVRAKAEPQMQNPQSQVHIDNQINAIGYLHQYFVTVKTLGMMAEKAIIDDAETREALLVESE